MWYLAYQILPGCASREVENCQWSDLHHGSIQLLERGPAV